MVLTASAFGSSFMPVIFVDIAQECAPQIAPETLAAIVSVESGFQPFAIRINSDHPLAEQPKNKSEAIEAASILIADGIDIDLGLGGVNSGNLSRLGLSVSDAFDFCLNLKATAALLDGYYRVALQAGATDNQAEAIMLRSYFGNGDASIGTMVGYDQRVVAERQRLSSLVDSIVIVEGQAKELPARERAGELRDVPADDAPILSSQEQRRTSGARWDVFNAGRQSSVLVFSNEQKE